MAEEKKVYLEPEYTKARVTDFAFKELVVLPREIDLNEWLASNSAWGRRWTSGRAQCLYVCLSTPPTHVRGTSTYVCAGPGLSPPDSAPSPQMSLGPCSGDPTGAGTSQRHVSPCPDLGDCVDHSCVAVSISQWPVFWFGGHT